MIRKELSYVADDIDSAYKKELENLSLLSHLKHPNIVPLFCSYQYMHSSNFIFAVADHGDLAGLLKSARRPSHLTDEVLIHALAGLASAIDAVHNFTAGVIGLQKKGCHHDLAPRNILVHDRILLLADFGISTFKDIEQQSDTPFKENHGTYVAPECQEVQGSFMPLKSSRASDIWSFGCILAEVLTYMRGGAADVARFQEARKFEPEGMNTIWKRFHRGPKTASPAVTECLDDLAYHFQEDPLNALVPLIRRMTELNPKHRPKSAQVLSRLRCISVSAIAKSVEQQYYLVCQKYNGVDPTVESRRFKCWSRAFEECEKTLWATEDIPMPLPDFDYSTIIESLRDVKESFNGLENADKQMQNRCYRLLRLNNTRLMRSIPKSSQDLARNILQNDMLQSQDLELLSHAKNIIDDADGGESLRVLLTMKQLLLQDGTDRSSAHEDHLLDPTTIHPVAENPQRTEIYSLEILDEPSSGSKRPVLVERCQYNSDWSRKAVAKELKERVDSVARLLSPTSDLSIPCTFRCRGILHDSLNFVFGLVYDLPPEYAGTDVQIVSLAQLLKSKSKKEIYTYHLQHRFALAREIASSVLFFHRAGWLHRRLDPTQVVFVRNPGSTKSEWIRRPYIVGFSRSRQNQIEAFTHGPEADLQSKDYQSPAYLSGSMRYREEFDYYSLGMLLLEIGCWDSLSSLIGALHLQHMPREKVTEVIIEKIVSKLGYIMGTRYMEATLVCLGGRFGDFADPRETPQGRSSLLDSFRHRVVDQIGSL